jgi:hypothetical protein
MLPSQNKNMFCLGFPPFGPLLFYCLYIGIKVIVVVYKKLRSHGCGEKRGQQYGRWLAKVRKKPLED